VAAFDTAKLAGPLEVRYATGHETYDSFSGETEAPAAGELEAAWPAKPTQAVLTRERPRFEFASSSASLVMRGAPADDEPPR
jgi:hypothetical protein